MKKVATSKEHGYDYYVGQDANGRTFYNIVQMGAAAPTGGYYGKGYILGIKHVPDLFN